MSERSQRTTRDVKSLFGVNLYDEFPADMAAHMTEAHPQLARDEFPTDCDECKRIATADRTETRNE